MTRRNAPLVLLVTITDPHGLPGRKALCEFEIEAQLLGDDLYIPSSLLPAAIFYESSWTQAINP